MKNIDLIKKLAQKKKVWRIYDLYERFIKERSKEGKKIIAQSTFERLVRRIPEIKASRPKNKDITSWEYRYVG